MSDTITQISNLASGKLELIQSGNTEITGVVAPTATGVTINHNLGYVPLLIAYFSGPDTTGVVIECNYTEFLTVTNYRTVQAFVDENEFGFSVELGSGAGTSRNGTYIFKYYIFRASAGA